MNNKLTIKENRERFQTEEITKEIISKGLKKEVESTEQLTSRVLRSLPLK